MDREQRFKIRRDIPKISAETGQRLLDEFDEFEEVFVKTDPRRARDWALALEEALVGRAKSTRDFAILHNPGRQLYEAIMERDAPDPAYADYYRFIRAKLLEATGLHEENPGESVRKKWEEIMFPSNITNQEDVETTLETLMLAYRQMVRYGV